MEKYKIEFLKIAKKELAKLPRDIQERIAQKINALKANPYPTDVKQLKNGDGRLRIRVGDYRIIYKIEKDKLVILVVKIGHRSEIYRDKA